MYKVDLKSLTKDTIRAGVISFKCEVEHLVDLKVSLKQVNLFLKNSEDDNLQCSY